MVCSSFPSDGDEGDDYFIPLPHASVSKFGPISRMAKAKTGNAAPVQVTADVRIYLLLGYDVKYFILLGLALTYIYLKKKGFYQVQKNVILIESFI